MEFNYSSAFLNRHVHAVAAAESIRIEAAAQKRDKQVPVLKKYLFDTYMGKYAGLCIVQNPDIRVWNDKILT